MVCEAPAIDEEKPSRRARDVLQSRFVRIPMEREIVSSRLSSWPNEPPTVSRSNVYSCVRFYVTSATHIRARRRHRWPEPSLLSLRSDDQQPMKTLETTTHALQTAK